MKNILMVVENLNINKTSGGIVSSTFIKLIVESGYSVTVITENNFNEQITWLPENVVVKKFDIAVPKKTLVSALPKVKAIPTYITGFSLLFRNSINQYKKAIYKELSLQKYDCIYSLAVGNVFAPHFALAEMKLNIPYFLNIHDPFPMHLYPEPYRKPKTWISLLVEKKFKIALEKSTGISFPSKLLMNDMAITFPVIKKKGFVIPHIGTSLSNLPNEVSELEIMFDKSKINILHAGTLLGPRNPKFLLQAIAALNQENSDFLEKVAFTFIGNVNKDLTDIVANSNLKNVCFLNQRISYQKSLDLIKQADASLVIEAISDFSPFLPGKVADIVFANKVILTLSPENAEVRRLLGENYPYQSTLDNTETIKTILIQFYKDSITNKVNATEILTLKKYVSIEENSKLINKRLNL